MTIAEEIIHEIKWLRIRANKDINNAVADYRKTEEQVEGLKKFRNGLSMAIRVATQINNRKTRAK